MVRKFLLHRAVRFLSILCEGRPQTKGNGCSIMIRIGVDIGSTTLKCVVLNERGELLYKDYRRHFSRIAESAAAMLGEIATAFPEEKDCDPVISGSAGMGIADALGLPFIQEVYATRTAVRHFLPDCDVVIELGGEDAKILFLGEDTEVRMNGTCAGGTGAFIDQMATLLNVTPDEMNFLAGSSKQTYTIASRCGVFAKSDIQPLINQGASKNDICASIFGAVVNQTVAGLAQGRPLEGKIVYLGGPLTFLSQLRKSFDETLDTTGIFPENSLYYVALGAALSDEHGAHGLGELTDALRNYGGSGDYRACLPLFTSKAEYERFAERHARAAVRTDTPVPDGPFEAALGIDAGSTTVKAVVTDTNGDILYTRYQSNTGDPVAIVLAILKDFYSAFPAAKLVASCATGYGEDIIRSAFTLDTGVVETVAHFTAAKRFDPQVDFIIDIGGQDIKCFKVRSGAIDNIFLNEACSSGCGSFLQTFAGALGYSVSDFAALGLYAERPVDLGSRCTVFMNSSIKQAQKDGAPVEAISAGLSISVVKNALYKVIRAASAADLGERIVVQGGTFLNDAVLRAFEQELNTEVTRPSIAGLMGAYGAALYALAHRPAQSTAPTAEALERFTYTSTPIVCKGCTNACRLSVSTFDGGRRYISGNKCDKPLRKSEETQAAPLPNLFEYKRQLLSAYRPVKGTRGVVGIPMGLNFYENLPFWHAFFTTLGYEVIVSPPSTRNLYLRGQATIPSDTVCYPAKLMHGHIDALLRMGADTIFYPCMSYNFDEQLSDNHFNCPVVAYYPEVAAANIRALGQVKFIYDYLDLSDPKRFVKKAVSVFRRSFGELTEREIRNAANAAYTEYAAYTAQVRRKGEETLEEARRRNLPVIVLCGRPYHLDPEINHGIDELIRSMGAVVVSEDALGNLLHRAETSVLNQWTYHARLYAAAEFVCAQSAVQPIDLVQLVSFGCGIDAITTDEMRSILESHGKIYTQIKIDEITNLGAVKIRLRSLFSALEDSREGGETKQP